MAAAAVALMLPGMAAGQVLEIGEGGVVTVHDRPSVFDAAGARPIDTRSEAATAEPQNAPVHVLVEAAEANGLSPDLVEAVAWKESRHRTGLVSPAGAVGVMQLMPGTARELGVDPFDTRQNLHGGARYLSGMLHRYRGDLVLALAAYNAGPGAVDRYRGVPPFRETRDYVSSILERLSQRAAARLATAAGK